MALFAVLLRAHSGGTVPDSDRVPYSPLTHYADQTALKRKTYFEMNYIISHSLYQCNFGIIQYFFQSDNESGLVLDDSPQQDFGQS